MGKQELLDEIRERLQKPIKKNYLLRLYEEEMISLIPIADELHTSRNELVSVLIGRFLKDCKKK